MIGLEQDNRVLASAARLRARLEKGIKPDGSPITADLTEFEKSMDLTHLEWFAFQNAQARAHVTGKLSTAEAQTVYAALNGDGVTTSGWAEGVDLALKVTITQLVGELMERGR